MTIFVVQARGADDAALTRAHFIKDGFAWGGFAFGWLWLLYRRLWLAAAVYVALEVAFWFLLAPHVPPTTTLACDLLLRLWVGFEGNRLREARGARRAGLHDVIEAQDRDAAEVAFFARHASTGTPA